MTKTKTATPLKSLWPVLLILILTLGFLKVAKMFTSPVNKQSATPVTTYFDFINRQFTIDEQTLSFVTGHAENAQIIDQTTDPTGTLAAAIIMNNPDGSGEFYYLVGGMIKDNQVFYSTPILLGDRLKIESVIIDEAGTENNGLITVQYLDRPPTAPLASKPTLKTTTRFAYQTDGNLIQVLH